MKRLIFLSMLVLLVAGLVHGQATLPPANLSNTTPPAPAGYQNVQWQYDSSVPRNISGYIPATGVAYNYGYNICNGLTPGYSPLSTAITPGMVIFGSSNYWHTNISSASLDPNSAAIIAFISASTRPGYYAVGTLSVANVNVASGVLTIGGASGTVAPTVGRSVTISGTAESWLNGQTLTVTGVLGSVLGSGGEPPTSGITTTVPSGAPSSYNNSSDTGTVTTGTDSAARMEPNFGSAQGIPFSIVDSTVTPLVDVYDFYEPTTIQVAAPIPSYVPIEGLPPLCTQTGGDQHTLVLDKATCWDYEFYNAMQCPSQFQVGGESIWDFTNYNYNPVTQSSVDAAGFSVLPGLLRHDEVAFGYINHAIRMTSMPTFDAYVYPASHWAGDGQNVWSSSTSYSSGTMVQYNGVGYFSQINNNIGNVPSSSPSDWKVSSLLYSPVPMGMRLRLKSTFNMNGFSEQNQVILRALQTFGGIVADNGSNMFLTGTVDGQWNDDDLGNLHALTIDDFDVITLPPAYTVLNPGDTMTITGCTNATFLNGNTYVANMVGRGWSQETAAITHADYSTTSDTCTATFGFSSGSPFTLPAAWTASVATVNVTSNLLTLVWTSSTAGSNIPNGAGPVISSFTATPSTITAGQTSVLNWTTSGGSYEYLTQCDTGCPSTGSANPQVGAIRGNTVTVSPTVTTTYTLNVLSNASQYAITQQSVTVTVH
jgi:hypothetical protein